MNIKSTNCLCKRCGKNKRAQKRTICYACIYQDKIEKYPERVCYTRLKGHAKERGKEFTLTFEQFKEFCIKTEYLKHKGISKHSFHIDRIDETKGYTIDNIQCLTNIENVMKYIEFSHIDENNKKIFVTKTVRPSNELDYGDEVPF